MAFAAKRSWVLAIAAAIGAHVLLALVPIMDPREGTAATPPVVHLRLAGARPEPTSAATATEPAPQRPPTTTARTHRASPAPSARRPARNPQAPPLLEAEAAVAPAPRATAIPAPDPLPESLAAEPPLAPARVSTAPAGSDRAAYAARVRRAVEAQKQYPRRARRMRRQGVAEIDVTIDANGELATPAALAQSSGWESLDREALRMVRAAAPFPLLPDSLGTSAITIRLPVRFSLD